MHSSESSSYFTEVLLTLTSLAPSPQAAWVADAVGEVNKAGNRQSL